MIKKLVGLAAPGASPYDLQMVTFSLCLHVVFFSVQIHLWCIYFLL